MNSMTEILDGVKRSSRLFNEPLPPKPTADSLAAEVEAVIDELHETALNMRRLEHRLVVVKAKIEGLQTIQRP